MRITGALFMFAAGAAVAAELELTVVDIATDHPVAQTEIRVDVDGSQSSLVTGKNGVGVVPLPETGVEYSVTVTASAAGYVPTLVHWEVADVKLPESYTLRLERGTTISGKVAYDDGEPIEGASVRLYVSGMGEGIVQPAITDLEILTDAEGNWRCDVLPKSLTKLQVRVSPPEASRMRSMTFSEHGDHPIETLRDGSAVIEISRRYTLAGIVHDASDQPVPDAQLVAWPQAETADRAQFTRTDRDGAFEFDNVKAERMMISTVVDGMAPDMTAATPGPDAEPVEITLKPGNSIRGQVTKADGEPIEGVTVSPHTWLGQRVFSIEMKTDEEGRFAWKGAPEEGVVFEIRKPGYAGLLEEMLFAGEDEHAIVLQELLRVGGAVVDDETGKPLEGFKVYQGIYWESADDVQWSGFASDEGYKGEYELYIEAGTPAVQVRVEADGYLPVLSRIYTADEGYQRFDVRMKQGTGPSGIVRKPDGTPAAGVAVHMTPADADVMLKGGVSNARDVRYVKADDDGAYAFAPLYPEFRLTVVDDAGFVHEKYELGEDSYDLTLKPAASIDGELKLNGKPAPYERLRVTFDPQNNERLQLEFSASTDPDGRFALEGLPAGEAKIEQLTAGGAGDFAGMVKLVPLQSGSVARVTLEDTGRKVAGRFEMPDEMAQLAGTPHQFAMIVNTALTNSDDPRLRQAAMKVAEVGDDGTFELSYLSAGDYQLSWAVYSSAGDRIGQASLEFAVAGGDGPLDLGSISVEELQYVDVGDEAPAFEVPGLDGETVRLADFRGKYVLLDFWATWCGPCIGETPHLVETFQRFGGNENFAMIGLSLDADMDAPRDYTSKNGMNWTQAFLGDWTDSRVPEEYGVYGIPTIMLIGPDGKVVAKGLRGPGMADTVAKHLK